MTVINSLFRRRSVSFQDVFGRGDSWENVLTGGSAPVAQQLAVSATLACVDLKAASISAMPLQEFASDDVGASKAQRKSQILANPSLIFSAEEWVYACSASLSLWDQAIGYVTSYGRNGWPETVEWLNPDSVTIQKRNGRAVYSWRTATEAGSQRLIETEKFPVGDVIHLRRRPLPGHVDGGASAGKALAQLITLGTEGAKAQVASYLSGGLPLAHLKWEGGSLNPDEAEVIANRYEDSRRSNPGRPLTTGQGWSLDVIPRGDASAQMVEMRKRIATEIAIVHNVPPEMVGGESGSLTYSNLEGLTQTLEVRALLPVYTAMERAFSRDLLPGERLCRFNADAVVRTSLTDRYRAHDSAIRAGFSSRDERRALENMPPIPDGTGGDFLWPPYRAFPLGEEKD